MKKWTIVPAILLAAVSILSCNKNSNVLKEETASSLIASPSLQVKDMIMGNSTTRFYYNGAGGVDSTIQMISGNIKVSTIIYGKGLFIDSIHRYRQGVLTDTWSDVKYNSADQLSGFTRWYDRSSGNYAKYLLSYDVNGNIAFQSIETPEGSNVQHGFVYNQDKALTSHSFWLFGFEQKWDIKSDNKLNPFNKMPHLYIVAESPDEQQEQLNKYNSVERLYSYSGRTTYWTNEYDQQDRLIKRSNPDAQYSSYSLTYY
ncbi:MAG: hypothetical protein J7578_21205 [Chitinophagaceae bacterium]|nr:hypothetical protein [Chitinophagaceae bacterium]